MINNKEDIKKLEKVSEDKVGYKNPPKHTRFKKGQSGNPAGRKKKVIPHSLSEALMLELNSIITITLEDGTKQKIKQLELISKRTVQDAIRKDGQSRKLIYGDYSKVDLHSACKNILERLERLENSKAMWQEEILRKLDKLSKEDGDKT